MAPGQEIIHDVMVPTRDGTRLATDIYFPEQTSPAPVLLYRTPYCKDEMAATWGFAEWFAAHGYIVVQQDCRGCYKSEGETNFLLPEAFDGLDTLRWIGAQPWGDADIGSWGTSWSGWSQTAMAVAGASRLKTIVPMMSGSDAWSSSVRHGGALELRWISWAFWHSAENRQTGLAKTRAIEEALIHPELRFQDWLKRWPIKRGETQLARVPSYESWAFDLIENEDRTSYWNNFSYNPTRYADALGNVSALYIGSWYDSYARSTCELYQAHRAAGHAPAKLMMGGWLHGTQTVEQTTAGGIDLGQSAAIIDYKAFLLDWFDCKLRGRESNMQSASPVRIFVMGGGRGDLDANGRLHHGGAWRDEDAWPLARTDLQTFYLRDNWQLSRQAPSAAAASVAYSYDPDDPVPTIGGCYSSLYDLPENAPDIDSYHALPHAQRVVHLLEPGGFDQKATAKTFQLTAHEGPLAERADVLTFESEPLGEPLEVTGAVVAHLWVSTDAADTDFTIKLIDVYPESAVLPGGFALNITDSILRLRYRDGAGTSRTATPGEIYPIRIELYPTSNLFGRGHRIRVGISSSNYPRFDRNPNTGLSPFQSTTTTVARNTIHVDDAHPSHIVLPVIPSKK